LNLQPSPPLGERVADGGDGVRGSRTSVPNPEPLLFRLRTSDFGLRTVFLATNH